MADPQPSPESRTRGSQSAANSTSALSAEITEPSWLRLNSMGLAYRHQYAVERYNTLRQSCTDLDNPLTKCLLSLGAVSTIIARTKRDIAQLNAKIAASPEEGKRWEGEHPNNDSRRLALLEGSLYLATLAERYLKEGVVPQAPLVLDAFSEQALLRYIQSYKNPEVGYLTDSDKTLLKATFFNEQNITSRTAQSVLPPRLLPVSVDSLRKEFEQIMTAVKISGRNADPSKINQTVDLSGRFNNPHSQWLPDYSTLTCSAQAITSNIEQQTNSPPLSAGRLYALAKIMDLIIIDKLRSAGQDSAATWNLTDSEYIKATQDAIKELKEANFDIPAVIKKLFNLDYAELTKKISPVEFFDRYGKNPAAYESTMVDILKACPIVIEEGHPYTHDSMYNSIDPRATSLRLSSAEYGYQLFDDTADRDQDKIFGLIRCLLTVGVVPTAHVDTEARSYLGDMFQFVSDPKSIQHAVSIVGWEWGPDSTNSSKTIPYFLVRDSFIPPDPKDRLCHYRVPVENIVEHLNLLSVVEVVAAEQPAENDANAVKKIAQN